MTYSIYHAERRTELVIDETPKQNPNFCIIIDDKDKGDDGIQSHYLTPEELDDFIEALIHVRNRSKTKGV